MSNSKDTIDSQWVRVADRQLHYRVPREQPAPNGATIIMVHGLAVSSRYMLPTALQLAPFYHVYIPDLPGFGKSEKPDHYQNLDEMADTLAEWMSALALPSAVLVGNSLGCQIITRFAVRHPQRVHAAIFLGPTMDIWARSAHQEIGRWLLNIPFEPISLFPIVLRDCIDIGLRRFVATFRYGLQDSIEAYLPNMHMPTLVVRGARDTVVPQRWAEHVTRLLPQGRLVVVPRAAHDLNYNSPVELLKLIRPFLDELHFSHDMRVLK
jgi:2-hydroxy-6-oxonona-2,4-dienedioate hydrolase